MQYLKFCIVLLTGVVILSIYRSERMTATTKTLTIIILRGNIAHADDHIPILRMRLVLLYFRTLNSF